VKRGPIASSNPAIYRRRQLKAIATRWDARAASWDQTLADPACHLNDDDAYRRFTRQVLRLIRERREFCSTHGVIDAGCGTGLVLTEVVSAFAWGIGIDISQQMIRVARRKPLAQARFIVGDCFKLPSLCPKAGVALSRGVLLSHYGRRQGEALLQAARGALVEGGFLVFDFLNEAARTKHRHAPENKTWLTGEEACLMGRRAGFSTTRILGSLDRRVLLLLAETRILSRNS
jgi:SAM-dependent methyltransferase